MADKVYCARCKTKREMIDAKEVTMRSGRSALKGTCPKCGLGLAKVLPR